MQVFCLGVALICGYDCGLFLFVLFGVCCGSGSVVVLS